MRQLWIYLEVIYHLELYCVITDTHRGLIIKIRSPLYAKKQTNEQKKKNSIASTRFRSHKHNICLTFSLDIAFALRPVV